MKILVLAGSLSLALPAIAQQTTWHFNSLTQIGGANVTLTGSPAIIDTNLGKAIHFNGYGDKGDAVFIDTLPLAGTLNYTFEVIFRPASGGAEDQRFFHMQENGSESRRMFEIRVNKNNWCLDAVAYNYPPNQPPHSGVIMNCDSAHQFPLDRWYAIEATYDGKLLRSYVNGIPQGEIAVSLEPLKPGGTVVGARYNKVFFFKGDIFEARFTKQAIPTTNFLKVPTK